MKKFRKKPVVIEATQWNGKYESVKEMFPVENAISPTTINYDKGEIIIHTLEGDMTANINDWIIKGIKGEVYPCKPDIFEETYEEVS